LSSVSSVPRENQALYEGLFARSFLRSLMIENVWTADQRGVFLRDPEKSGKIKHQPRETRNKMQPFTVALFGVKGENTLRATHCDLFLQIGQIIKEKWNQAIRTWALKRFREKNASDRRLEKYRRNLCV
jgi:hypothetical protein